MVSSTRYSWLADAIERLFGSRRAGRGVHVEELSSYMRPTGCLGDAVAGEQLIEPGITVGMDNAAELLQMTPRA